MPARKSPPRNPRKPAAPPAKAPASAARGRPIRREVGAGVLFFLSLLAFLGLFGVEALVINWVALGADFLFGWGFTLLPFALLGGGLELSLHGGRPVRLRLWATLLIPLVSSALAQLWDADGGFFGEWLALGFSTAIHEIGAVIVFSALLAVLLFLALRLTPAAIARFAGRVAARRQPYPEPPPKPEKPAAPPTAGKPTAPPPLKRRPSIDIPIDDTAPAPAEPPPGGPLLKPKPENIKTPAEALREQPEPVKPPKVFVFDDDPVLLDVRPTPPRNFTASAAPAPAARRTDAEPAVAVVDAPAPPAGKSPAPKRGPSVPPPAPPKPAAEPPDELDRIAAEQNPPYPYPPLSLLNTARGGQTVDSSAELQQNAERLMDTLSSYGLEAAITGVTRGPTVTRYEMELEKGVKLSRLTGLSDDIALRLGASGVRIAPVADKMGVVGVEIPNRLVSTVYIRDVIDSPEFLGAQSKLAFAVGRDITGAAVVGDISRLTHLLIAGTTGSGKSVCTNSLIVSLLYKSPPDAVKLILIDPKMVELGIYNGVPHLLIPVVTDPKEAASALKQMVFEMEKRYRRFMDCGVRDIFGFNELVKAGRVPAEVMQNPEPMPQIVIVIDELADLMMTAAKDVEDSIVRIAQKARAAGMHLVVATQRPSADVITGLMKANIPSRIAFAVSSAMESRIILDGSGAEKLVGRGDMLYQPIGAQKQTRVQGCLISSKEVEDVVAHVKLSAQAEYSDELLTQVRRGAEEVGVKKNGSGGGGAEPAASEEGDYDSLLPAAIEIVVETGQASASMLQRRLKLGYSRAARIIDQMEEKGVIGPYDGSKPRQVLIAREDEE